MISIKATASGREYKLGRLDAGELQFMDREYRFAYIPEDLRGAMHVMTCGSDKMIAEDEWCFSLSSDTACDVYVLYADKQPELPVWLNSYERLRMNVTRTDSDARTLKGYFSIYKKHFEPGEIVFGGNSPRKMIAQEWYAKCRGTNYCMYTVAIKEQG